jgi:hypothetical protein
MARARNTDAAATSGEFTCPECGKTFPRAASLGAHRSRTHGVAGATAAKRSQPKRAASSVKPRTSAPAAASTAKRGGATASTGAATKTAVTRKRAASRRQRAGTGSNRAVTRRSAGAKGARGRSQTTVDRDALLQALFPAGIPARDSVLRQLNGWLAEAERLAKLA